jgi:hypothetical protein
VHPSFSSLAGLAPAPVEYALLSAFIAVARLPISCALMALALIENTYANATSIRLDGGYRMS